MSDSILTELPAVTSFNWNDTVYVVSTTNAVSGESTHATLSSFFGNIPVPVNATAGIRTTNAVVSNNMNADNVTVTTDATIGGKVIANSLEGSSAKISTTLSTVSSSSLVFDGYYDMSKIINVNTTITPTVTAMLDINLPSGFNVGIFNIGTGSIVLSSQSTIKSLTNRNNTQNTGFFLWKDTSWYGIGRFD